MNFEEKFKPGDIICSDSFYGGKCMVVEGLRYSVFNEVYTYKCQDLIIEKQTWSAYEFSNTFGRQFNWRIATDDDIVNYLSMFVRHSYEFGEYKVKVTDNTFTIESFGATIYLEADELAELGKLINKYVTTEAQEAKVKFNKMSDGWFLE